MDTTCLTLPVSNTQPCSSPVEAARASAILQPMLDHDGIHQKILISMISRAAGRTCHGRFTGSRLRAADAHVPPRRNSPQIADPASALGAKLATQPAWAFNEPVG